MSVVRAIGAFALGLARGARNSSGSGAIDVLQSVTVHATVSADVEVRHAGILATSVIARALVGDGIRFIRTWEISDSVLARAVVSDPPVLRSAYLVIPTYSLDVRALVSGDVLLTNASSGNMQLFIGGELSAVKPQIDSVNVKRGLNNTGECTFALYDESRALPIGRGSDIVILWRGVRLFAGIVTSIRRTSYHADPAHLLRVRCVGYTGILAFRIVSYEFDPETQVATLRDAISDLYRKYFTSEAILFDAASCPAVSLTEPFVADNETMFAVLTRLCELTGTAFEVDETRTLRIYETTSNASSAPFDIEDNNGKFAELEYEESDTDYANAIVLRGTSTFEGEWTDTFSGENTLYQAFNLTYTPLAGTTPRVFWNNVEYPLVSEIGPDDPYKFSWLPGFPTVYPRTNPPAIVPFAPTDQIRIVYRVRTVNALSVRDAGEIAVRKARELGTGLHEMFLDVGDTITDPDAARAYAESMLETKVLGTQTVSYLSADHMPGMTLSELAALRPGQVQRIDTTQPVVDISALIETVEFSIDKSVVLRARVSGSVGRVRDAWDRKLLRELNRRAPKSSAQDMYGWALAEDIPDRFNPGLIVTGRIMAQFVDRDCIITSALITSTNPATGADVVFRLYRNGTVFVTLTAPAGQERTVVSIPSVACKQYDRLELEVVQIGTTRKGSNYRVRLSGTPTGTKQTVGFIGGDQ